MLFRSKAWAESANRSPEFYFQPVKDIHKGYHVSIAKRLQDKRDIFKEEQLALFDEAVNYQLKSIDVLSSDRAVQMFGKGKGNGWSLEKILSELQVPKDQIKLILSFNTTDRAEILTDLLANYSYTVEINTAKSNISTGYEFDEDGHYIDNSGDILQTEENTQHYANLAVPGGTNYTENEIKTPAITPSIKGHAQFATNNGIGWFRSDEQITFDSGISEKEEAYYNPDTDEMVITDKGRTIVGGKTRRILEVQSDLFQKGRGKNRLTYLQETLREVRKDEDEEFPWFVWSDTGGAISDDFYKTKEEAEAFLKQYNKENPIVGKEDKDNQFLQLLNKDNNWVTFFVKSIIQDSAKKGYEKVLFPKGDTASKIEGHSTLEEFKKQKEDRIKELEEAKSLKIEDRDPMVFGYANDEQINNEINQLKQELERVEKEGFAALRPIYKFYEETIGNILKKQGYNPQVITDEYGNQWYEVEVKDRFKEPILFDQQGKGVRGISLLKENTNAVKYLQDVAESKHPLAFLAKKLLDLAVATPIRIVPHQMLQELNSQGKPVSAAFLPSKNEIWVSQEVLDKGLFKYGEISTVFHEILHALSYHQLRNNTEASRRFNSLYEYVKTKESEFSDKYPLANSDEFLVAIFTNPKFIDELKNMPAKNSRFESFWHELYEFFRTL